MLSTLATSVAGFHLVISLLGCLVMMSWPSYRVTDILNSREKKISILSLIYYISAGYLIITNPGTAAWILAALILIPIVTGWLGEDHRYHSGEVPFQLWMALAQLLAQAACIVAIVF